MKQTSASLLSFGNYGRNFRWELFLDEVNLVNLRVELQALVEPHYPKAGNGRRPAGFAIMLRTYFMQRWFNLSDPRVEEAFANGPRCVGLRAWTLAWLRHRMKPCCASAICS